MEEIIIIVVLCAIAGFGFWTLKKQSDKFRQEEFDRLRSEEEEELD